MSVDKILKSQRTCTLNIYVCRTSVGTLSSLGLHPSVESRKIPNIMAWHTAILTRVICSGYFKHVFYSTRCRMFAENISSCVHALYYTYNLLCVTKKKEILEELELDLEEK